MFSSVKNLPNTLRLLQNAEIVLAKFEELAVMYETSVKVDVLKDKDDNKFLELAVTADASYLITGNKKDFSITEYDGVKIITPKEYWEQFNFSPLIASEPVPVYTRRKKK